ncbi:hypothetical protein Afil01_38680 [Actinorhabdospora filicis]|uniref:Winged helix DNA-binding domain-containing protein n=1 Tax=Actinorhabdospora filicis TaxID=1785913 RepID=A0A9W6SQU5_9ACTN|nr:winged helix DNA-binding domain-containing protein [Actinorhabdospora filicis]GLZ79061.1 hypothetical protein Afil01_38680 [Actinorhabdospora filicis]
MRTIGAAQRRARLAARQLAHRATPLEVARALVVLHGSDPASPHLSIAARGDHTPADVERAMYDERVLVRMHAMRRTVFVVPADLVAVVHASSTVAVAARERRQMVAFATAQGFTAFGEAEAAVLKRLAEGEATGAELGRAVPALRTSFVYGRGTSYEAAQTLGTRLLPVMGMEGSIIRGRPKGSWTSATFTWSAATPPSPMPPAEAEAALVGRWLAAHGPGTEADLKWWTGWTLTAVRRALTAVGAVTVALDEGEGFVLPGDEDDVPAPPPSAALLPALDPTPMGWKERGFYLSPDMIGELFDRNGNIGPTLWWDGRVIGGWSHTPSGEIAVEYLADPGADGHAAVDAERERLARLIGDVRVTPRFRTPLEKRRNT